MNGRTEKRAGLRIELRDTPDGKKKQIAGYAAVFNELSEDIGGFKEIIAPGAFRRALKEGQDIRCLWNHDASKILGRTKAGTCRAWEDEHGLAFECDLPNTSTARDMVVLIDRGDVSQCSFSFLCRRDTWTPDGSIRTVLDADLFDVSPVMEPAYTGTAVGVRALPAPCSDALRLARLAILKRKALLFAC